MGDHHRPYAVLTDVLGCQAVRPVAVGDEEELAGPLPQATGS